MDVDNDSFAESSASSDEMKARSEEAREKSTTYSYVDAAGTEAAPLCEAPRQISMSPHDGLPTSSGSRLGAEPTINRRRER
ncbi:hypothetical protein A4X13_0g4935 [Tilletia indica]|uniref:Uncharacterized protein n=1 Tax=Tilletia indica TaxID=43049 RepID=A0A8T8SVZ3_9BASI|nr:hypothetical protein A4X13_0g4935 [Tilletia indica]